MTGISSERFVEVFDSVLREVAPEMPAAARAEVVRSLRDDIAVMAEQWGELPSPEQIADEIDRQLAEADERDGGE